MFYNCTKLVGGAGTKYDANHVDVAYAHIDGGVSNPGYLTRKSSGLPNTGCDEDWLQQRLDEIAAQKPAEPVELTVCEEGITLTKSIKVDRDCKAVLTGGPITAEEQIDFQRGFEGLFMVYGELGFHDIKLNLNNDVKTRGNLGYFWLGDGTLQLLEGTEVNTTNGTVVAGFGTLDVTGATIKPGGSEMLFGSALNTTVTGGVFIMGKQTYCNGKIRLEATDRPIFSLQEVYVTSALDLYTSGMYVFPKVYLYKDATLQATTGRLPHFPITGQWDQMTVGRAFVTSSTLVQKDYDDFLTISGLPTNRRAEFVAGEHAVKLLACGEQSVNTALDQLQGTVLPIGPGATNVLYISTSTQGRQNITINGRTDGSSTSRGRIHFQKNQTLTVPAGHTLTLTNLDIDGEEGTEGIVVGGTLVIGANVHVADFTCFVQLLSGGHLLVSGALASGVSIRFVNGASNGQVVAEGTAGYQLTEQDLALLTVEGYELQLDTQNNRIVVAAGTGIEALTVTGSPTAADGIYDLSGRRIAVPRRGVYIVRTGGSSKKIFIK